MSKFLWTTEAVSAGHPDKLADQISDAVLDAHLVVDPTSRVACETMVTQGSVILGGEITSDAKPDLEEVVRKVIRDVGYDREDHCFDANSVAFQNKLHKQSPEIDGAVSQGDDIGAGDQGLMFGFACNETDSFMPLGHVLAFELIRNLEAHFQANRNNGLEAFLLPDAKSQVTIEYAERLGRRIPGRVNTIVVSASHHKRMKDLLKGGEAEATKDIVHENVREVALEPMRDKYGKWLNHTRLHINPGGVWTFCGPAADTGLTGRKIVVDNYGPYCPIGGGCFSGKDPTKVDRSAAYAARHIAKNIVAAELSSEAQVQLSYAIGVTQPVSVRIKTEVPIEGLSKFIMDRLDLSPRGIIEKFNLQHISYLPTASGGHFGNPNYPWEALDMVEDLRGEFYTEFL